MKTKIFRISKQTLSIVLALMMIISTMLVGMVTVGASVNHTGGYVYFDNTNTGWTDNYIYLVIGHDSYSSVYQMTKVSNTNLYRYTMPSWSGATYCAVLGSSTTWGSGYFGYSTVKNADHYTGSYFEYRFDSGSYYIITPSGSSNGTSIDISYKGTAASSLNTTTQSYKVETSSDGETYSTATTSPADIALSGYYFTSFSSCSSTRSTTTSMGSSTVSGSIFSCGLRAKTTLSVTNIDSGYTFDGWYNGSTKVSDAVTYTYYPNANTTLTARFTQSAVDSQLTSTVSTGGTVTYSIGDSSITPPCTVTSGNTVTVNAEPDDGYELDSIKVNGNELETGVNTFVMPKEDTSVEVTFVISNPTVSITPSSATVAIGQSITLAPEATHALGCTGVYTVEKDSTSLDAENYIENNEFCTPMTADAAGVYTITYTATVNDSDVTGSAVSTITVSPSAEQQNYALLAAWLSDATKTPEYLASLNKYTTASLKAYEKVYTAADDVDDTYPVWNATENTTAYNNLAAAYEDLTELISLDKPVLNAVPECVDVTSGSKTVELSVNTSYPTEANVEYEFYVSGNSTPIYTGSNNSYEVTLDSAGTYSYYVKIVNGNEDEYYCNDDTSTAIEVEAVTTVTVSVEAGENGTAYISKYYQYDGAEVTSNVTSNTTVQIKPGTSVTFTAVPASGFAVENWNGSESEGSTTYTKSDITSAYTASVTFVEESEIYFYVASANSWGTSHPWVTLADKSQGTLEKVEKIISNGYLYNSSTKVQSYTFDVYLFKVTKNTPIIVGNNNDSTYGNWSMYIEEPVSGACYYYGNTTDTTYNEGTINPMTLTSVTATSTNYVKDNKVTFSVEAASHNGKTAGQDDYTVTYTVCDASGTQISTGDSFTPTTAGQYTVKATAVDNTSGKIQTNTVSKTFTIYDTLPQFKVFYGSNNSTMGSVSTNPEFNSGSSVDMGTSVTFTANPSDTSDFIGWYSNSSCTGDSLGTDTTYTTTITKNTYVYAKFAGKASNYSLVTSSNVSKGQFRSTGESNVYSLSLDLEAGSDFSFYIESTSGSTSPTSNSDFFADTTLDGISSTSVSMYQWNDTKFKYVTLDVTETGTYEFIWTYSSGNGGSLTVNLLGAVARVNVYAKDGTIRDSYEKYVHMADTEIVNESDVTSLDDTKNQREECVAQVGTTLEIKTTIKEDYRSKYYVKAFCVNGESYSIIDKSKADTENGVYTLKYTIPEDIEVRTLEITPIYFYIDEADTVTFYVEGFDSAVKEKWGDTIACHAYYDGGDDDATYDDKTKNALGGYPGQPMVYEGGKYYMQIPKYLNGDTSVPFKGITLNNYVWDDVHKNRAGGEGNNCQTYDYNDLYCISNLGSADNIIFSFKYRTKNDNDPSVKPSDTNKTTVFTNGWENLTDYYGRDVDVFGTVLTEEQINSNNRLRIISNGYQSNNVGTYATEWTVYAYENSDWTKIATLPSSSLLYASSDDLDNALSDSYDKYVTAYKALEAYKGYPAEITYEKSITGGEENGNRSDGRWYYSKIGDTISVNTRIEYAPDANGPFVEDSFIDGTAQGKDSGTKAYFTNEDYNGLTSASGLVDKSKNFTFKAESDTTGNYMFIGWYLLKEGSYTLISKEYEWYAPMTSTETYVARFIEVPDGMLTVTHELYSKAPIVDGMVAPNGGTGTCYAKVEVVDTDGNVVHTYAETTGSILIDETYIQSTSTNKLKVTLRTDIAGLSEFNAYYVNKVGGYTDLTQDSNKGATGSTTRVVNFNISELFYTNEEGIPVFYVPALNFYSDIIPVTKDYKLTFNYDDRFGNSKSYVVMGKLSESYINENLVDDTVVLTNEFIMSKAPYEDNFGKIITWSEDTISKSTNNDVLTATIGSTQTDHTVVVNYRLSEDDPWENIVLPYGSLVIKENTEEVNEEYVCVAELENSEGLKFSHWEVYTDSSLSNLVTKCYYNEFNFRAYDNYYITAVYSETPESPTTENISTTLDFLEYSRNQWTDDEGNKTSSTDKLYADFALGFNYNGLLINSLDNVKCGMALEVCGKLSQASDGSYISDLGNYSYDTDVATLKNVILNGGKYSYNGETRNVINTEISTLTNKNRVEFYQSFNNSTNNPLYIIKCYSYMIIDDSTVVLSDPVYISLYDVANLTYTVS